MRQKKRGERRKASGEGVEGDKGEEDVEKKRK